MPSGKCKRTGAKTKGTRVNKRGRVAKFSRRHIDQVWEDVRKEGGVHDGKVGPLGSADRVALDEDLPAHGQHFCVACTRYFISQAALATHERTKPHRRRVKELLGVRPHNQADADWAGGMGAADNGQHDNGGVASMGQ